MGKVIKLGLYRDSTAKPSQPATEVLCQYCALTGFELGVLTAVTGEVKDGAKCADCGAQATKIEETN